MTDEQLKKLQVASDQVGELAQMPQHIGAGERRLLEALDEQGGSTAGQVARQTGWSSNIRSGAQLTRRDLERLVERGLARHLDDAKPTCWVRTKAGTEALGL